MTNTTTQLRYPDVFNDNKRLKLYANKILADLESKDRQYVLDYLSDRLRATKQDGLPPITNVTAYLDWIVKTTKTAKNNTSFGIRDKAVFRSTELSRTITQIAADLLPHRVTNLSTLDDKQFDTKFEKLSEQILVLHNKTFEKISAIGEKEKISITLAHKEASENKKIADKEERMQSGNNAFDRLHEKYPGMSSEDDYFFEAFVTDYVDAILAVTRQISSEQGRDVILKYAQDIESLVKDYMEMLCSNNDASGQWKDTVKYIEDAFNDSDNNEYRIPRRMATRNRYVVALFFYCKNKSLIDKNSEILTSVFGYDRGYIDKLTSSLLPIIEKQIDKKLENIALSNA